MGWESNPEIELDDDDKALIASVKQEERADIALRLNEMGNHLLHSPDSDAIDGYVAGIIFDLADRIKTGFQPNVEVTIIGGGSGGE